MRPTVEASPTGRAQGSPHERHQCERLNYPSALARRDLGVLQSLNFLLLGVFAAAFAQGMRTQFTHRSSGLVAIVGLGAVAASGLLVAFVASGLAVRSSPGWRGYWVYSLANVPLAIAVSAALSPWGQPSFYGLVVVLLAWYGVMGARLRRLADAPAAMHG